MPFPTILPPTIHLTQDQRRRVVFAACVIMLLLLAILLGIGGGNGGAGRRARPQPTQARTATRPATVVPPVPQPVVEPLELIEFTPDRARLINSMVPFVSGPVRAAPPFKFAGSAVDRVAATACLATAAYYEAGDDPVGQRSVVQVVLNRVRHPAYPKTVCGVVFQGSERRTGCQFSFTCDGAMVRRPSDVAWTRAEDVAAKALAGAVDRSVGYATHYHTDWVVPYWSATLDKLSRVKTHLFFRWRGYWGTPGAFRGRYAGGEVVDPRVPGAATLATADGIPVIGPAMGGVATFDVPAMPTEETVYLKRRPAVMLPGVPSSALHGHIVRTGTAKGSEYALELEPNAAPDGYLAVAQAVCRDLPACTVGGWLDPEKVADSVPFQLASLRTATFLYQRRAGEKAGRGYWNCRQVQRADKAQCLPGTE
ncbi:cell wall hydrolase [Sphingomonas montana]|uniref:cell wall hydrolase n=1 Tax=Sphingomonas montana TaxID=1843236 RepID=UPI00096E50BB|nr:cell wall hydrolase [Sphingomonas montana]